MSVPRSVHALVTGPGGGSSSTTSPSAPSAVNRVPSKSIPAHRRTRLWVPSHPATYAASSV